MLNPPLFDSGGAVENNRLECNCAEAPLPWSHRSDFEAKMAVRAFMRTTPVPLYNDNACAYMKICPIRLIKLGRNQFRRWTSEEEASLIENVRIQAMRMQTPFAYAYATRLLYSI